MDCDHQERDLGGLDRDGVRNQEGVQACQPHKSQQMAALNIGSIFDIFKGVQQDVQLRLTHLLDF